MGKLLNSIPLFVTQQVASKTSVICRNLNLSFKILGEGTSDPPKPPVLILPGLLGRKKQWEGIGKTIMNITQRTVVAVDLRNHGDSPHGSSHKFTHQANDVIQLVEKLGVRQVSLIGHSMGGRTAMCVALMAPRKVAGLLIVDMSPKSSSEEYTEYLLKVLNGMKKIDLNKYNNLSVAQAEVSKDLKQFISDEYIMRAIMDNLNFNSDTNEVSWSCNLDVLIKDYKYWVSFPRCLMNKKYSGPTLFLGGQLSEYIPADDLTTIRDIFPQAVVMYIPNTKHRVHVDDPETFLVLTISFIRTHSYRYAKKK